jgi:PAS domain S-box-containing protein
VPPEATPREVAGWFELLLVQDREVCEKALAAVHAGAADRLELEFRIRRADGEVRHMRTAGLVMQRDADGRSAQMTGINWDVTARARATAAVHESEERLRLLIGGVREHSVYLLDPSGRIASWNPGAERITGYSEAEIVGRDVACLFPAEAAASGEPARILAAAAEHGHWEGDGWRLRKDGSQFLARIVITARRDPDGTLRGFTKIAHDLSDRKMQEAQRAIIIESAPAGMMIVDDQGIITLANSHAEALFGYGRGALTGVAVEQLVPEARRARLARLRRAYTRGAGQAMSHNRAMSHGRQFDGLRQGGGTVSVEVLLNRVSTPHGNITVATVLDASERTRRKEERMRAEAVERAEAAATQARLEQLAHNLEQARDQAQHANEAKSRFLAGITHELRTPLHGILGYAQLLRLDGGLSPQQDAYVDAMLGAGEHLVGMINAVLDLSQIEANRLVLMPVPVALQALAQACLDLVRPTAQAKSLALHLLVEDAAPVCLIADKTRLRQVLLNLLGNAVKFTPSGGVTLRILPGAASGVRLEVADTGPGIAAEQSAWLFQEFSRLPDDTRSAVEGSGLGLAITARLLQRMGGSIGYGDNQGGGAVFWVELPSSCAEAPAIAPAASSTDPEFVAEPLRVLVADDDPTNRAIAAAMLRHAGHMPVLAEDGEIAVSMAGAGDFDVILMDVRMPGIDGLEAVRRIRRLPPPRGDVPVVALTAQVFANQIERCYAAGMDDHLSKPLEHGTMLAVLARVTAARVTAARNTPNPGNADLPVGDAHESGFDETQFLATRNLLPPESFQKHLHAIAAECGALQIRLAKPDALADIAGLVDDVHKAGSNAGAMGMFRLAAVAKQFEYAAETSAPDITAHAVELAGALSGVSSKLFSLSGST